MNGINNIFYCLVKPSLIKLKKKLCKSFQVCGKSKYPALK